MKKLMNAVDRFCWKHPRFGVPNLMLIIVIGNAVLWLLSMMDRTGSLISLLSFAPSRILHGQIWRLVTFVFVPDGGGFWFLVALYFYYFIGSTLEREWGTGKFTMHYLCGMLLTVLYGFIVYAITRRDYALTAGYINLAMFFSFATLFPDNIVLLFFILPIKIKWLAILDAVYFLYIVLANSFPYNLVPLVAVINYLLFCGGWLFEFLGPTHIRQRQGTVNFRREAKKINRERASRGYNYKCAVCGRTDTEYPELEFRYCSRCQGYHCFCQDHINNHVHFTS